MTLALEIGIPMRVYRVVSLVNPLSTLRPRYLTIKELAAELKGADGRPHSRGYVHAMKLAGFPMPARTATVEEARAWLAARPAFSWRSVYVTRKYTERTGAPLRVL
jgi:hypothetical protein